jgi:hypothetical protein
MASGTEITQGTKEYLAVDVDDRTGMTTDLSTASPKFWFQKPDDSYVYNNVSATAVGMQLQCLIDTSSGGPGGLLAVGQYRLYVGWTRGSEQIKRFAMYVIISLPPA